MANVPHFFTQQSSRAVDAEAGHVGELDTSNYNDSARLMKIGRDGRFVHCT